jgi:hypothetical protein
MVAKWKIVVPIGVLWLGTILWGMHALLKYRAASADVRPAQILGCAEVKVEHGD